MLFTQFKKIISVKAFKNFTVKTETIPRNDYICITICLWKKIPLEITMAAYQIRISQRFSIALLMNTDALVSYGENLMGLGDRKWARQSVLSGCIASAGRLH